MPGIDNKVSLLLFSQSQVLPSDVKFSYFNGAIGDAGRFGAGYGVNFPSSTTRPACVLVRAPLYNPLTFRNTTTTQYPTILTLQFDSAIDFFFKPNYNSSTGKMSSGTILSLITEVTGNYIAQAGNLATAVPLESNIGINNIRKIYDLKLDASGVLTFTFNQSTGGALIVAKSSLGSGPGASDWHFIRLTVRKTGSSYGNIELYVDGVLQSGATGFIAVSGADAEPTTLVVGCDLSTGWQNNNYSGGRVDPSASGIDGIVGKISDFRISQGTARISEPIPTEPYKSGGALPTPISPPTPIYNSPAFCVIDGYPSYNYNTYGQTYTSAKAMNWKIDFHNINTKTKFLSLESTCSTCHNYSGIHIYNDYFYRISVASNDSDLELQKVSFANNIISSITLKDANFSHSPTAVNPSQDGPYVQCLWVDEKNGFILVGWTGFAIDTSTIYSIHTTNSVAFQKFNFNGDLISQAQTASSFKLMDLFVEGQYIYRSNSYRITSGIYINDMIKYTLDMQLVEEKTISVGDSLGIRPLNGKWYSLNAEPLQVGVGNFRSIKTYSDNNGFPETLEGTAIDSFISTANMFAIGPLQPTIKLQLSVPTRNIISVGSVSFNKIDNSTGTVLEYGLANPTDRGITPIDPTSKELNDAKLRDENTIPAIIRTLSTTHDYKDELNGYDELRKKTNTGAPAGTGLKMAFGNVSIGSTATWPGYMVLPDIPAGIAIEIGEGPVVNIKSITYVAVVRFKDSSASWKNAVGIQYDVPVSAVDYNLFIPFYRIIPDTMTSGDIRVDIYDIVVSEYVGGSTYKKIDLNSSTTFSFSVSSFPPRDDMLILKAREYRNDAGGKADIYLIQTNNWKDTGADSIALKRVNYDTAVETTIYNSLPCYPSLPDTNARWAVRGFEKFLYLYDSVLSLQAWPQLPIGGNQGGGLHAFHDYYYILTETPGMVELKKYDYSGNLLSNIRLTGGGEAKIIQQVSVGYVGIKDLYVDESNSIVYVAGEKYVIKYNLTTGMVISQVAIPNTPNGLTLIGPYLYTAENSRIVRKIDAATLSLSSNVDLTGALGTNQIYDIAFESGFWYIMQYLGPTTGLYRICKLTDSGGLPGSLSGTPYSLAEKLGGKFNFVPAGAPVPVVPCPLPWSASDYDDIKDNNITRTCDGRALAYKIQDIAGTIAAGAAYFAEITKSGEVSYQYQLPLVRVGLFDPPKAIQGLQSVSFVSSLIVISSRLTWAQQSDASTFRIWRTTDGSIPAYGATPVPVTKIIVHDAPLTLVTEGGKTFYAFSDALSLVNAQQYTYTVYPVNPVGVGGRATTAVVAGDTTAPDIVRDIKIETTGDATNPNANMTWTNPKDPDFKEVKIIRKQGIDNVASGIGDVVLVYTGTGESFNDIGTIPDPLQNGAAYTYTFFASDFIGNLSKVYKTVNPVGDITPPGPVKNLNMAQDGKVTNPKVTLTWENPADTDLKGVLIMRRKSKNSQDNPRTPDEAAEYGFEVIGDIEYRG